MKPWEAIVRWYLQGNHSFQGFLSGAGFRPSTVGLGIVTSKRLDFMPAFGHVEVGESAGGGARCAEASRGGKSGAAAWQHLKVSSG